MSFEVFWAFQGHPVNEFDCSKPKTFFHQSKFFFDIVTKMGMPWLGGSGFRAIRRLDILSDPNFDVGTGCLSIYSPKIYDYY